uniref:Ig-like domain-containing protein n=1 Tax=Seriola dumerili TaxID=41447 RepID=A0A3B4U1U1_SERDU
FLLRPLRLQQEEAHFKNNILVPRFLYVLPCLCQSYKREKHLMFISHGGIYHCRGGRRDTAFSTENSESVTIEKTVSNKAVVFLQPNWPLVFTGETITVRCGIHGGGSTEWEYEWSEPKSSTVPAYDEYRIDSASVSDSGNYRCKGKDKRDLFSSTEWSDVITLTVSGKEDSFAAGGRVTLTCSVNPSSSGWKYYWYTGEKTSEPLTTQDAVSHSSGDISVSQEGLYWCRGGRGDPVYYTEFSDSLVCFCVSPLIKQMLCCHLSLSIFFLPYRVNTTTCQVLIWNRLNVFASFSKWK